MEVLIPALIILLILLVFITLLGHGIWLALEWIFRELTGRQRNISPITISPETTTKQSCHNCGYGLWVEIKFCGVCGARRLTFAQEKQLSELETTVRQLNRLHEIGALAELNFRVLKSKIENEREQMLFPHGRPGAAKQPSLFTPETTTRPAPVRTVATQTSIPPLYVTASPAAGQPTYETPPRPGAWARESDEAKPVAPVLKPPRKPFAEVLAAFMEQSNIRWGEIIGGLLIIGCSTALVISLWAQISRVPTIKFLIFTTVTAALFGIGFYTEHHWKLPTTSRGILTIATLLVPLNFLAIAAVSANAAPLGAEVIVGELIAPAIFLCLIYFAARVITPKWPHLLAAGALGSSVGQLLIRHFAQPDNGAAVLISLGAFPVVCYVAACGWMLKLALADGEIDGDEATSIFITLGTLTFAAVLPFALLLYKVQSTGTSMLHLAPLITLGGAPLLATGFLLWRRARRKELVATRTAGASVAILGATIAVAGMLFAWPNPASIVPAALFNFALFTAMAVLLDEPRAHVIAAACLTLGYLVAFHVIAGHVSWQNLGVTSLLEVTASVGTGQALVAAFVSFAVIAEWWSRKPRPRDAFSYLLAACGAAVLSLVLLAAYGIGPQGDPYHISAIIGVYAIGAFWFAWRQQLVAFGWTGVALLFLTSAQICDSLLAARFPWLSSFLLYGTLSVALALTLRRFDKASFERLLVRPLHAGAIAGSIAGAALLLIELAGSGCEPAFLFAIHAFVLSAVWLGCLSLNQAKVFFLGCQIAVTLGALLVTKALLQTAGWYGFQPSAWLHPWALQIQGSVLGIICLGWIGARLLVRRRTKPGASESGKEGGLMSKMLLDLPFAFDHVLAGGLVIAFVGLLLFGTASGISKELTNIARPALVFNLAGFPHELIFGLGSLILMAILLAVMLGNLRERRSSVFAAGALLVLWAVCPLVAGRFESQFATASAGRWSLAIFLLLASLAYAFGPKRAVTSRLEVVIGRTLLLFITLTPLVLLTLSPIIDAVNYVPARGPQWGIFRAMGTVSLYGIPLILAGFALGIHAVRERSASFAFATGLLVNFTVTVVQIASVAAIKGPMNRVVLVSLLQLNAVAAASVGLAWLAMRAWWMKTEFPLTTERVLLTCQKVIAVSLISLFLVPTGLRLIAIPDRAGIGTFAAGGFEGWLAVLLTIAFILAFDKLLLRPLTVALASTSMLAAGSLLAFRLARLGVSNWAGFHVLLGALILVPWILILVKDLPRLLEGTEPKASAQIWRRLGLKFADDWASDTLLFVTLIGSGVVLVSLRGPFSDPLGAWWSIAGLLSTVALAAALNWITYQRAYLYASGILLNMAVSIWLIKYRSAQVPSLTAFVEANVIVLSLAGVVWLCLELRAQRARPGRTSPLPSFHHVAAIVSLAAIGAVAAIHLHDDLFGFYQSYSLLLDWIALSATAVLLLACLWDREATYAVAGIYLAGLLALANGLHNLSLGPRHLVWGIMATGAAYTVLAALTWRARAPLMALAGQLKIPSRVETSVTQLVWLNVLNTVIATGVLFLSFWIELTFPESWMRAVAAIAVISQAFTFGLMAEGAQRRLWQRVAVTTFLFGVVFLGWSFLMPGSSGTWLNRAVIVMTLMLVTVTLFGLELDKLIARQPDWAQSFRDCVPAMTIAGILSLVFVLTLEVYYQIELGTVRVSLLALATVALTLAAAAITCIFFALSPRHDPHSMSEAWRGVYVYVGEITLVLLFMHIRLTMPWLFTGFFQRYWPLVVLAIAYAGVAVSELLKRNRVMVLARPIERTGAFLPLLPVIGFWIAQSQVKYSTLLFVVGGLYGLLAILRRSFWFGLAAALAGNGGLWYLLHETSEYGFFQHPQLWLIPAAVSVLIASHLNRKDFSEAQMTGVRYLCLVTIYVSSTADIFINGVAHSPWLPLVLAGLSVAGVFAGIIFRVQAFLLLGSMFLLLSIATMINYASVNFGWTWLWYVAGIVTGAMIIATFAVFEKKRADVLRVVDELKDWKG